MQILLGKIEEIIEIDVQTNQGVHGCIVKPWHVTDMMFQGCDVLITICM